ncbi:MAG TPA: sugar ABC transporter substrate-binding protein, partial [Ruminococcus sp.]|nr:sugar ABC transporter substrate-binding protein [Ruminococcus sp.]
MKKIAAALLVSAAVLLTACSASDSSDKNKASDEIQKKLDGILSSDGELLTGELENKTIKFLSTWDINPDATGKSVPLELALFQQKYGGNIETKIVSWSERYEQLAYSINGGEGIDFFPANDFDAFPKGAIKDMFVPVDDYIDYSSPLWTDVKEANDCFMWDGKHYIICTDVTSDCIMIYNRTVMNEMGFEDPAKLYSEGKWTWDTLKDMLSKFCDENESR